MNLAIPLVSVVVPMYNVERYLHACIESVLAQRFSDFEIVCVDDGCTDGTLDVLAEFDDPRIRLVRQRNRGLAAARNTGIRESRGPFVALLDADDLWLPGKLEAHCAHLASDLSIGVSYSASDFIDDVGERLGIAQRGKTMSVTAAEVFCRNPVGNGSSPVIRRAALSQIARPVRCEDGETRTWYFDESMRQSEDIECWLRIALNTRWRFAGIDRALTLYRVNPGGLSANVRAQLAAWEGAVERNRPGHEAFFDRWYRLARAYQKRYLARRAVQSGDVAQALRLIHAALLEDWRIVLAEPARTLLTYGCAVLSLLPERLYRPLERCAMQQLGRYRAT